MTIQRINARLPLREFYLNYYIPRKPVILQTDGLHNLGWHVDRWTDGYLIEKAGDQKVKVLQRNSASAFGPDNSKYKLFEFADFIHQVMAAEQGDQDLYLNLQNIATNDVLLPPVAQLKDDFDVPPVFKDIELRSVNIWMGNNQGTTTTHLHHDYNDNLYVVVEGRKHFTIFPPEQAANLYPRGEIRHVQKNGLVRYKSFADPPMPHFSRLDPDTVDLEKYPAYKQAETSRVDFHVEQHEILFLPAGWFHKVSSIGRHIALSFFAAVPTTAELAAMADTA
ncbi:MAG: cupin-like domain-containing protein [Gammaproteobacteria bacterium]|nr:cupin-like domain-containing protein [Gammaproteobacteria bacterium]